LGLRSWVTRWWAGEAGAAGKALDAALWPAEALFRGVVKARNRAFDTGVLAVERVPVPVISVGNVGVGGAGKTPFAAWLADRLRRQGRKPAVALRGYGGDEVILHRELNPEVPVFAAARRVEAARRAVEQGCDVIVLDDAFQHRRLARDLDVVLVPVEGWRRDVRVLPRGPWREDVTALQRADLVVLTRKTARPARSREVAADVSLVAPGKPIVECHLAPRRLSPLDGGAPVPLDHLAGRSVLAVAALAQPGLFLENLRHCGAEVEAALYPDHHPFSAADAAHVAGRAAGRVVVMTHKDAVKLRGLLPGGTNAYVLEQTVEIDRGLSELDAALKRALETGGR
jgi:tetraacyldisaccharide 4'-kinase